MKPSERFKLEKSIYTDHDFDVMGWHDVYIHGIAFKPEAFELYFDIDYMFAWVDPEPPDNHYTFWLSSCTWVFSNVWDFVLDVSTDFGLQIADVSRELIGRPKNADSINRDQEWKWKIECQEGILTFKSVGYEMYIRRKPIRAKSQFFNWADRGGINFDKTLIIEDR
jgi:hypothetical protein